MNNDNLPSNQINNCNYVQLDGYIQWGHNVYKLMFRNLKSFQLTKFFLKKFIHHAEFPKNAQKIILHIFVSDERKL